MNPVGAGRHPGIATHQHEGGFPHLINHLQPSDGQDALHWCYYTQLSDHSSTWVQPHRHHSGLWRQGANWPTSTGTSLGEGVLCCLRMAVTRSLEASVLYLRSLGSSCENFEVPTFPALTLWCPTAASPVGYLPNHTHRKVYLLTARRSTGTQTEQLKKEAGRRPAKLWAILSDTPLVPGMSLFPLLSTVTRKALTVYKSVLTTIIS